jgi:hypothetical protein
MVVNPVEHGVSVAGKSRMRARTLSATGWQGLPSRRIAAGIPR